MRIRPRGRPFWILPALLAYGAVIALGCAGAGKTTTTGKGGSSNPGSGGTSSAGSTGSAGTTGTAGTTGSAGTSSSGSAGSVASGAAGTTGAAGGGAGGASAGTTGSAGATGSAGTSATGTAGTSGTAGTVGTTGSGGAGGICQTAEYHFDPKIPTVYVLVDRSGSEFINDTTGVFFTLRSAALQVIHDLEHDIRFGLGVFTGQAGVMCPIVTSVAANIDNYTAIAAAYNGLGRPQFKAETPAAQMIGMVKTALQADAGTGQKYMLFVTDSETDYCNDGSPLCPLDSVTYRIQDLYAAGFGTFIIGLPSDASNYSTSALQGFANAGAGLPVGNPMQGTQAVTPTDIYNQCNGEPNWKAMWTAAARTGNTATATYAATGGNAKVYTPDPTNQTALVNAIASVVAGVKSCTFDLSDVGGKSLRVDTTKLNQAHVKIEGTEVLLSTTNGWNVDAAAPTQLLLSGTACATWRTPASNNIEFQFPCGTIIFE